MTGPPGELVFVFDLNHVDGGFLVDLGPRRSGGGKTSQDISHLSFVVTSGPAAAGHRRKVVSGGPPGTTFPERSSCTCSRSISSFARSSRATRSRPLPSWVIIARSAPRRLDHAVHDPMRPRAPACPDVVPRRSGPSRVRGGGEGSIGRAAPGPSPTTPECACPSRWKADPVVARNHLIHPSAAIRHTNRLSVALMHQSSCVCPPPRCKPSPGVEGAGPAGLPRGRDRQPHRAQLGHQT